MKTEREKKIEKAEIRFWYDEKTDAIHVTTKDKGFHIALNDKPDSKMGHPQLHRRLKEILKSNGKWPEGKE